MKALIVLLMLVTVGTGLFALAGLINAEGTRTNALAMPMCGAALISGVLFLVLAARQSRKDREAREDRLWQSKRGE